MENALKFSQKVTSFAYDRRWKNTLSNELTLDAYVVMFKAVTSGVCAIGDFGYDNIDDLFFIIKNRVKLCVEKECHKDIYEHVDDPRQDFARILYNCIKKFDLNHNTKFFTYFRRVVYNMSSDVAKFRNPGNKYNFCYDAFADSKGKACLAEDLVHKDYEEYVENVIDLAPTTVDDYAAIDCISSVNSSYSLSKEERDLLLIILHDPTTINVAKTGASSLDWTYLSEVCGLSILRLKQLLQKSILPKLKREHLLPSIDTMIQVRADTIDMSSLDDFVSSVVSLDCMLNTIVDVAPLRNILCVA
jgi:hypothetical protein